LNLVSHFENVPHPYALPIIKHKTNIIMNLTYNIDHETISLDECMAKLDDVVATIIKDVGYGNT